MGIFNSKSKMASQRCMMYWKEFEGCARNTIKDLLLDNDFADVSLACDDSELVLAHKVILSSSSAFFKRVLSRYPHKNPLIYIKGVQHAELESIIKFVYLGQTEVEQDNLGKFLEAAKTLEIRGLADVSEHFESINERQNIQTTESHSTESENIVKEETKELCETVFVDTIDKSTQNEEFFKKIEKGPSGKFYCENCTYESYKSNDIKKHRLAIHGGGVKIQCNQCDKIFSGSPSLRKHISSVHEAVSFPCTICNINFSEEDKLKNHTKSKHEPNFDSPSKSSVYTSKCNACNNVYTSISALNKHLEAQHA